MVQRGLVVALVAVFGVVAQGFFIPWRANSFVASQQFRIQHVQLSDQDDQDDIFPELDILFSKASIKLQKSRESVRVPVDTNSTISLNSTVNVEGVSASLSTASAKASISKERNSDALFQPLSSILAAESILDMMQYSTDGGLPIRDEISVGDQWAQQADLIRNIEEAKSSVSYLDRTGKKHKVPISSHPLWYTVAVRSGKEKKVVEAFQDIIRDSEHPLNAFIVDSFIHVRPAVSLFEDKSKNAKKKTYLNEDDMILDKKNEDSVLTGGKYGYAPRKTSKHLKFTTLPTAKGIVFIKASMNPVIHDMILREVPNLVKFAADDEGTVYPVLEKLINPLIEDRQALYPEEQSLAKTLVVGSYVKVKSKETEGIPHLGYGYILGVQDGFVRVSVKCEKTDLEFKYDIRDLDHLDGDEEEFRTQDERSRIKQMIERLIEEEPNSRILKEFKRRGILDDFLYPERRAIRERMLQEQKSQQKQINSNYKERRSVDNAAPRRDTSSSLRLSPNEAQVAASFGGFDEMRQSMESIEKVNADYERATRRKLSLEQQMGMSSSSSTDDFSFLDDIFASTSKAAAKIPPATATPESVTPSLKDMKSQSPPKIENNYANRPSSTSARKANGPKKTVEMDIEDFMDFRGSSSQSSSAADSNSGLHKVADDNDVQELDKLLQELASSSPSSMNSQSTKKSTSSSSSSSSTRNKNSNSNSKGDDSWVSKTAVDQQLDAWFRELDGSVVAVSSTPVDPGIDTIDTRPRSNLRRRQLARENEVLSGEDNSSTKTAPASDYKKGPKSKAETVIPATTSKKKEKMFDIDDDIAQMLEELNN